MKNKEVDRSIYQIKVALKSIKPPVWRRVLVTGKISLLKLHKILQVVMGWTDSHLHRFIINGVSYSEPDEEFGLDFRPERKTRLNEVVLNEKDKFEYEYDFGDSWFHTIQAEKIMPPEDHFCYPVCLGGERACPPEDCGGIGGYTELLEIITNPQHPDYEERIEWVGEDFEPEKFDLNEVNRLLKRIK